MIAYFEVHPSAKPTQALIDRYIELKTATLGYFECQLLNTTDNPLTTAKASLFAVRDGNEADMLMAALQQEFPDEEFEIVTKEDKIAVRFNSLMI